MGRKKGPQDDIIVSIRERRDQPMNMEYVLGQIHEGRDRLSAKGV